MSNWSSQYNRAVWFEIPVSDLERASAFYRATLALKLQPQPGNPQQAVLESAGGNSGSLVLDPDAVSDNGVLIYLNVEGRLREAIEQALAHGGRLLRAIQPVGDYGFRAVLRDSEGNRIALHARQDG